jgi:NAD(P)-dependent dehydrogenase (short-subunit alcohol dehydrogenase family)
MVGPTVIHGDAVRASLANKTALVTGASRGIGRATAETIAKAGGRGFTLAMQALKRIGQPSDVADVIAFLASDGVR